MIRVVLQQGKDGVRIREAPINGKPIGQIHADEIMYSQESDAETIRKVGVNGEWIKIATDEGKAGFIAAWLVDFLDPDDAKAKDSGEQETTPTPPAPESETDRDAEETIISVRPTVNGLRLRDAPIDGEPIGVAGTDTVLFSLEDEAATKNKIGIEGEWLKVKTQFGETAYTAAWLLMLHTGPVPKKPVIPRALNITGVNLDVFNRLGNPDPARLRGMGWVRLVYDVSAKTGSEDLHAAAARYRPVIEKFARAGFKVMLVFTHQTYGEGKNEFWPWPTMTREKWQILANRLAVMVKQIVAEYQGQNLVHAYQIWNEMDAHIGAVASVPMRAEHYAIVLGQLMQAIKAVDPGAIVITGGHTRGPGEGAQYARAAIAALPAGVLPDGIAFHPYGRGITAPAPPYTIFGHIIESIKAYGAILPDRPLWITEWGVLDRPNDNPAEILQYARGLVTYIKNNYGDRVASLIWYAWAMGMHNGYGLVDQNDQPLQPLYDGFRQL